jgi:DNA-binding LacI/PurR family transcriptional regulator
MGGEKPRLRTPTLKDIARELGISAMAVSKALNGKGGVGAETLQRVKETAERLNYQPNAVAKSLRLSSTKTIGVVVSDSSLSFFAKVVKGIEETASRNGYSIILCNTDQDCSKEKLAIQVLVNKRIDGLILAASMLTRKEDVAYLRSFGIPFVFLIRRSEAEEVDYVINDNIGGACQMVDYLVGSGSRKVHFINLNEEIPSRKDRLSGYRKALEENGISYEPSLVRSVKPTIEDGHSAMVELLDGKEEIQAVFCGCDVIGIGVMEAILERGLRIPQDIRVAAYDDIDFAAYLRVPLTTVRQPKFTIGCKGTELLIEKIRVGGQEAKHLVLQPELVIRMST